MKRFWTTVMIIYVLIFFFGSLLLLSQAAAQFNETEVIKTVTVEATVTEFVTTARDQLSLFGYSMPVVSDWLIAGIIIGLSIIIVVIAVDLNYYKRWSLD